MALEWMSRGVSKLTENGVVRGAELRGCTELEIQQIERACPKPLPAAYKQFLSVLGAAAGGFLMGSDFLCAALPTLRSGAQRLLEESGTTYRLAADDFVFAGHQGYTFLFFRLGTGDDPEVYRYVDCDEKPELVANTFSEWFLSCVDDEVEAHRALMKKQ